MSKLNWGVFAAIVGVVIVSVALEPDHESMAGMDHSAMVASEIESGLHTVTLAVSGMT